MPTVLVASGGTGGHLFPALALAKELVHRDSSTRIVFVGAERTATRDAVVEAGYAWSTVPGRGLPRRGVLGLVPFAWALLRGVLVARALVRRVRPDVAVGFGNYGSVAPLYAAHRRGVPVVIHEANVLPGRANRLLARYARAVAVQFAPAGEALQADAVVTGMPVREELFDLPGAREARRAYGLDENAFTLLVMGGSQGAQRINEVVVAALPEIERLGAPVQVVHLCGAPHEAQVRKAYRASRVAHAVRAFETDMGRAYAAADCALCRAGAATLAELAATATPSLLVPYPHATEDHQARNAAVFAAKGAAQVVAQESLEPAVVAAYIERMLNEPARTEMGHNARALARPDAANRLADLVEKYIA